MNDKQVSAFPNHRTAIRSARCQHGMTITEILVVIAIILILLGLGVLFLGSGQNRAMKEQTRTILAQARTVASNYLLQSGQSVNHSGNSPFNWSTAKNKNVSSSTGSALVDDTIERFLVGVTGESQKTATPSGPWALVSEHLPDRYLDDTDADGFLEVIDGWGRKIEYYNSYTTVDGTKHPQYSGVFFVSAGSDGQFGSANDNSYSKDNIYSYQIPSGK